jgi:hypothetical protein
MHKSEQLDFDKITAAAIRTAKWATTMTKWRIGFETRGKKLTKPGVKPARRWQLVGFPGPAGRESAGIVDLIAIRKDHATVNGRFKRGDLFEIISSKSKAAARGGQPPMTFAACAQLPIGRARDIRTEGKREA